MSWIIPHSLAEMPKKPRIPPNALDSRLIPWPRIVEVLVFPAVQLLDVAGPLQVFATANDMVARERGDMPYATRVIAADANSVISSAGLELAVAPLPIATSPVDTLLIAGGPGVHAAAEDLALRVWVTARAKVARRVASVCTGAFLLAASGLLDGRRAATHWSFCADLAGRYPAITVEPEPIFLCDGGVWTSAGVASGIDLALALVEQDLGRALALAVARHLVVFLKRPGGQSQFSAALSLQSAEDQFGLLHDWINKHLHDDITVSGMADRVGMSERSFARHYAAGTGQTPARAVERLRVEAARRLLSETRLPVKRISQRCGFGSEETMRRSFLRQIAVTPQDYRARFSS